MVNKNYIKNVAEKLGVLANAEKIILFGSYARKEANSNSDIDLLIIANSDLPKYKRSRELYKSIKPYPIGMDLLVYTPAEIEKGNKFDFSFISKVLREGETVYAK